MAVAMGWWYLAQYVMKLWHCGACSLGILPDNVKRQFALLKEHVARNTRAFAEWWPLTELPPLRKDHIMDVLLVDWWHRHQPAHGARRPVGNLSGSVTQGCSASPRSRAKASHARS